MPNLWQVLAAERRCVRADAAAVTVGVASTQLSEARPPRDYITKWPKCEVHYLILAGDDFIVFLDKDLDVDWSTTQEWEERNSAANGRGEILNLVASVECIPNDHQRANGRLNFKRMVGEGVARALDGEYESAKEMLDEARSYIDARNVEKARYWQLCTACMIGMIVMLGGLFLWRSRELAIRSWGEPVYFLALAGIAGSIGAVLSMIFRMGKSSPSSESPRSLHILEAGSRVLAGCFSALLASGAVQVGLILSVLSAHEQLHAMMLVVGFASGASERLAPSIIARIESSPVESQPKKTRRPPPVNWRATFNGLLWGLSLAARCDDIPLVNDSDCPHSCRPDGLHLYRLWLNRIAAGPGGTV